MKYKLIKNILNLSFFLNFFNFPLLKKLCLELLKKSPNIKKK